MDPNFQRDIQVEPPLKKGWEVSRILACLFPPDVDCVGLNSPRKSIFF